MKIEKEILNILERCTMEIGKKNIVYLPPEQLDRKTYLAVNKCLEAIGGKWSRKEKGHIFEDYPVNIFENLLLTGEVEDIKKEFQFFETPKELARQMIEMAELKDNEKMYDSIGVDSTEMVELVVALNKHFGIKIETNEITKFSTPQEIVEVIEKKKGR